ncbi:MAG: ATP-binding cassette domain-containing protein, partial [Nanobdellota archaeon]
MVEKILELDSIVLEKKHETTSEKGFRTTERKRLLNNLSLTVWSGFIHAIVGPNGAGKSTIARLIMGLESPDSYEGDIRLEGKSIKHDSITLRARKGIALAWQEPTRFEGLQVKTFLDVSIKDKNLSSSKRE